jgi:hypothetical protein
MVPNCRKAWVIFFFVDPKGRHTLIYCKLKFECTSSTTEYEEIFLGLKKTLDFKIKCLNLFDVS